MLERAQGAWLGQLAGDALGGQVEFSTPDEIRSAYPHGVRRLEDGGRWDTLAGQPTDDSEMALALARTLVARGDFQAEAVRRAYVAWLDSEPFDCGLTVSSGLRGQPNAASQANGAMMRASPLGIFGASHNLAQVRAWAEADALLTHPHPVCVQANALYVAAIAMAVAGGGPGEALYRRVVDLARAWRVEPALLAVTERADQAPPGDYLTHQGWVLIAWGNALWQLRHAPDLESGVVDTIARGGDTDTNAAICGALLGAVHGRAALPGQWREKVLGCRPRFGQAGVRHPRPELYWPADALELAGKLLAACRVG